MTAVMADGRRRRQDRQHQHQRDLRIEDGARKQKQTEVKMVRVRPNTGGHDLTFPFVRAVTERHKAMSGVYFDAHLDVRAEVGSGMPFRSLIENCGVKKLTCIGLNPLVNSREHFEWFTRHGGSTEPFRPDAWPTPPHCPDQFVSIDLDSIDSARAPGVSAPNPAGLAPQLVAAYAHAAGRNSNIRCFDIMELNPDYDQDGRTARLAAHLLLSFLRGFSHRPGAAHP